MLLTSYTFVLSFAFSTVDVRSKLMIQWSPTRDNTLLRESNYAIRFRLRVTT